MLLRTQQQDIKPIAGLEIKEAKEIKYIIIGSVKYELSEFNEKIEHIKRVAKNCAPTPGKDSFKNVVDLFGENTYKFKNLRELNHFLTLLDSADKDLDVEIIQALTLIRTAVTQYEAWKVTIGLDEKVRRSAVASKLKLKYTLPHEQVAQIYDVVAIKSGFDKTRDIVKKAADDILKEFKNDDQEKKRKKEIALALLKLVLNIVNAGVAVELVHHSMQAVHDESQKKLILDAIAEESLREGVRDGSEQLSEVAERVLNKSLSRNSIECILDILWELAIVFIDKNIEFAKKLKKELTEQELSDQIEKISHEDLLAALRKCDHPDNFDYNDFFAESIAKKMKQENERLIEQLKKSVTHAEMEAKTISSTAGLDNSSAFERLMTRYFYGNTLCRDYFKNKKKNYQETKIACMPGYKVMKKMSDNSLVYLPIGMDQHITFLLNPNPIKGKMHIGGKHSRAYIYEKLPDLNDPVYGYKARGKYKNKMRIKDTWRADQVIQILLAKSQKRSLLPFPTFKSPADLGDSIITIVKANALFKTGDYKYKKSHPTPLYLFTRMKDYTDLLERPGVKDYLKNNIDINLIIQSITDPNIRNDSDKPRMMQVLDDVLLFLEKIGYEKIEIEKIRKQGIIYIDQQCQYDSRIDCMRLYLETVFAYTQKGIVSTVSEYKTTHINELRQSLHESAPKLNHLINFCEDIRSSNLDDDRIALIEEIIASYIDKDRHDSSIRAELHGILPRLFLGDTLSPMSSRDNALINNIRSKHPDCVLAKKLYEGVKKYFQTKNELQVFEKVQKTALTSTIVKPKPSAIAPVHPLGVHGKFTPKSTSSNTPISAEDKESKRSSVGFVRQVA